MGGTLDFTIIHPPPSCSALLLRDAMKLHADHASFSSIQSYGPGWIQVNGQRWTNGVVLAPEQEPVAWSGVQFDDLTPEDFSQLLQHRPEVVLFGSGERLRHVRPALLRALVDARVGVETMGTAAACRTYNILSQEGRRVVAALLVDAA